MQRALSLVVTFVAVLFTSAAAFAQSYTDDFQSYGEHANPPGWVDSPVGVPKPDASGLYKTWGDPTQGNKATNVVFGTKQSSGKADPNGRMGTFSTYTTKSFTGAGRFEYRGRFIRTNNDSRIGLTFFSSYPEKDQYYLAGLMPQAGGALTMQLLSFGAGTLTGVVDSKFTPNANQWCWFAIQADAVDGQTLVRARFWIDGSTEPSSWSIDAVDSSATRLTAGRVGIWAAIKGDSYVDDLTAKSAVDHVAPVISFFESNVAMTDNKVFNRDAAPEIRVTDDSSGVGDVTIKLDGNAYVSKTTVTGERYHQLDVDATDNAGNSAHATIHFAVDKTPPVVSILDRGTAIADGAVLNHDVTPVISVTDLTPVTMTATLDGAPFTAGTVVSAETQHTITAAVTDSAQHTTTRSVTFSIDKRGPSLTLVSHKDGDVVTETTIVISGGADDSVQVKVNGVPAQLANAVWTSAPITLVEGSNPITVTGVDSAGNVGRLTVTIALDTRAPQLVISSPAANACLDTTIVDLHGTVADPHAKDVNVQFGEIIIHATLDTTGAWSANVPDVPEGKAVFLVTATDTAGHSTTVSRAVTIDRTEPVIEVNENGAPFTAKLINRALSLDVRATDADPNATLAVTLDGAAMGTSPVVVSAEGAHTLDATATDCAGLQSARKVTFTIDRTPPVITNLVPANGATIGAAPASIQGSVSEAAAINISGTELSATVNAAGAFELAGATFIEGLNRFTLHAVDDAGNASDVSYSVTLRTIAPAIEFIDNGSPIANGALFNRGVTPIVRVSVSDATTTSTLDGQPFTSGTAVTAEGAHTLSATAVDPAGHSTTASVTFTIDVTAPVVKITAPTAGQTIDADHVTVSGSAGDAVSLTVNGSVVTPTAGGAFSTDLLLDLGENLIVAAGRDRAGNNAADQLTVTRSDAGTGILLTLPVDRSSTNRRTTVVSGRILTPANATSLKIGTLTIPFDPTGAFTVPDFPLVEGANSITATLTSANGKTTSATTTITCDLTPPVLRILANAQTLDDDARFASSVTLTFDATDGGNAAPASELRVDGTVVATPLEVSAAGAHTAIATAIDAAGNQTRVRRYFSIGAQSASGCSLDNFDPASNSVVAASSVTITGGTGGAAGVKINGVPAAVANNSFSGTAELSLEGANAVSIVCTDAAGRAIGTAKTLTLIRVTNAPSITIQSPAEMAVVGAAKVAVSGTIGDGVTEVTVNGAKATISGSSYSAEASLSAGLNIIVARAKNGAGRYGSASRRVVALLNAPSIGIDWPNDGFATSAGSVEIAGTYANIDPTTLASSAGGTLETHPGSDTGGSFVIHGVVLNDGAQSITITGHDAVGHAASAKVDVSRDGNAPSIVIATPFDGSYAATNTVAVTGSVVAVDGSRVDIGNVPATLTGATFSGNATLGSGAATPVVARVTQPDGSSAIATSYVTLLSGAPTVTRFFPAADAVAVDSGVLVLTAFSAPMNRASLDDGVVLLNSAGVAISGQRRLDRDVLSFAPATTLNPGERYTIVVKTSAKDLAGNSVAQEQRSSFTITTTAPATAPQVDAIASPLCATQITITGNAPASSRLEINISGVPQFTTADATGRFSALIAIPAQSGYRVARVRVIGGDGSYSPSADAGFEVDCAGPVVNGATYDRIANAISVTFSKSIDLTTAAGAISLKLGNGTAVTSTVAAGAANSIVITPGSPDPRTQTLVLTIATTLKDSTGRALASTFSQTFTVGGAEGGPSNGSGFISGQVLDASNGRPLAGATVAITPTSPAITLVTDANGRYASAVDEGAFTIHASADGFTDVWRQVIVPAGSGIVPIDIRVTARGAGMIHGGDDSVTRKATLTVAPSALPAGATISVTSVGSQSLAGLLPLGWSPIAAAEVRSSANGLATLAFELPAAAASSGRPFTAVEYDHLRDEWRVLQAAVAITANVAQFSVSVGQAPSPVFFALVYPDALSGLAAPPVPVTGQILAGVQDPCATQSCAQLVTKEFPLDPKTVLPNGHTVATLVMEGTNNPYPSGTAVQAFVNEELTLLDGSLDTTQPFSTDLILYRSFDGATSSAAFRLAPSARAGAVPLQVGVDRISVYPYPGRLDRGTLVGPAGGPIPSDDRVQIDIPTGAAPSAVHATATSITDFSSFTIAGFDVVGGFNLTLTGADSLLKPANVRFTIDPVASGSQLVVAEIVSGTPYGRIYRMVANTNAPESVAASKVRVTTAAIDPTKLPLDGVVRPGQYLLLRAKQAIAFAFGSVRLGASGGYLSGAQVITSPLGVTDVTRPAGLFVIPVIAKPEATFTLTPSYPATGTGAVYSAPAVDAGLPIAVGDLVLASQPPALQHVNVISTSGGIDLLTAAVARDVVLTTSVEAIFSQSVSTTNANAIAVTDATGHAVGGSATVAGSTLTWTPSAQLAPNAAYVVTIDGGIRGAYGAPLGSTQSFGFSTVTQLTSSKIDASKIHITIPDANGFSTITGDPGALPTVPPEPSPWRVVPLRRGHAFTTVFQATAANDGSFTVKINPVTLTDHIDLEVLNSADNIAAILPLGPFASENGQAFVAPADETVTFTSRDGVGVTVPAGSFDEPTTISITRIETSAPLANVPNAQNELNFTRAVQLDFSCAPCASHNRIDVSLPVSGADPTRNYLLGYVGQSVRGPRVMIVDTLRIDGGNFTTTFAAGSALRTQSQSVKRAGAQEVLTDLDVKRQLLGVVRSGIYTVVNIVVPGGTPVGWAAMDSLQGAYDLFFDKLASLYASHEYLIESRGRVVVPVLLGVKFEIVGVDAGTGLQAFNKVYDPLPVNAPGGAFIVPTPQTEQDGPYPIFASPGRVEIVDLKSAGVDITSVRNFIIRLDGGYANVQTVDMPAGIDITILNVTTPDGGSPAIVTGRSGGLLRVKAKLGDRIVLVAGAQNVDPASAVSVVFSRRLFTNNTTDPDAINTFLHGVVKLQKASRPAAGALPVFRDISALARYSVDSDGRRLNITLNSELERGASYRIDLLSTLAAANGTEAGLRIGQIRSGDATSAALPDDGIHLFFQSRDVPDPLTSFDLRQDPATSNGAIRDLALNGNILLMSAGPGGILAYDVADPASLSNDSLPVGYVKAGSTEYWGLASDQHGRVYATGTDGIFGFMQSYRLEDFIGTSQTPKVIAKPRSAGIVCWLPGYSSGSDLSADTVLSDRPEGLPRKLQIAVQDSDLRYDGVAAFTAALGPLGASASVSDAGEFKRLNVTIPRENGFPYRTQRITVENLTRDMRWSADATDQGAAVITDVIARPADQLRIVFNERTYGVVTIFGYGVGIFDLNAMESNDLPQPPSTYKALAERVRMTHAALSTDCVGQSENPAAIPDLGFSPEVAVIPQPGASNQLMVYGADVRRGVLDMRVSLSTVATTNVPVCDDRAPLGLLITPKRDENTGILFNQRVFDLDAKFFSATGRHPFPRFGGVQTYHWILEAQDNKAVTPPLPGATTAQGQRGSVAGTRVERDYLLVPGYEYGLLIVDATAPPGWLTKTNLVDVIWIPSGAVAVRMIPRTHYATVVDAQGRVLLVDLSRIDERWTATGTPYNPIALFPTALGALTSAGAYGIGAPDPRIVWTSEPGLVAGSLAPVIDTDTGILFAGQLQGKKTSVVAVGDPRIEVRADTGSDTLAEVGGIVPLGIQPPANILNPDSPNASLGAFRLELTLPGGIAERLAGAKLRLAIESERVPGAAIEQTSVPFPRAHLRKTRADGTLDPRPVSDFYMERDIPAGMEQVLRRQKGFNKFISPWIVAIADPRASINYTWPAGVNPSADGCQKCTRPQRLAGLTEAQGVYELWSGGRDLAIRPEVCGGAFNGCSGLQTIFAGTGYAYLATADRLTTRIPTIMADTARMLSVQVAAQTVPLADGALQEKTYIHSGEVETGALDLDAGGRSGWNVAIGRTYRSRTIGGTPFGAGWESNLFKRLRALPTGEVEYRDGAGEVWTFKPGESGYTSPRGLFLKLVRTDNGWRLFDQQWRFAHFDVLGRLTAENDEFANPNSAAVGANEGNVTQYFYDKSGRLAQILDAVGRSTLITYWSESEATQSGAWTGMVRQITDWRGRKVDYSYAAPGVLVSVRQPQVDAAQAAAGQPGVFAGRPDTHYSYQATNGSFNDLLDFSANLVGIRDPAAVATSGPDRVTFTYNLTSDVVKRDRVELQKWATGEEARMEVTAGGAALPTQVTTTDALGQQRVYDLTVPFRYDGRRHVEMTTLRAVPVLERDASTTQASLTEAPADQDLIGKVLEFDSDGVVRRASLPQGLETTAVMEPAQGGAVGTRAQRIVAASGSESLATEVRYDTEEGAANNPLAVARVNGTAAAADTVFRDRPTPSRKRTTLESNDEDLKNTQTVDNRGQLRTSEQSDPAGTVKTSVEERTYYDETAPAIARGKLESVTRQDGAVALKYVYSETANGGERVVIADAVRNTSTTIDMDSQGRPLHKVVTGGGETLLDESYGYDANGQGTFVSRLQRNLGTVVTQMTYDAMLRPLTQSINNARVDGEATILTSNTIYDLPNRTITRVDPHTANSSSAPREVTTLDRLGRVVESKRTSAGGAQQTRRLFGYDRQGNRSYESDGKRSAVVHVFDAFGRETLSVDSLMQRHEWHWSPWGQPLEEVWLDGGMVQQGGTAQVAGHLKRLFTRNGELRAVNDELVAGAQFRQTRFGWNNSPTGRSSTSRIAGVASIDALNIASNASTRAIERDYDTSGRMIEEKVGELIGFGGVFADNSDDHIYRRVRTGSNEFSGMLPITTHVSEPRAGTSLININFYDGLGRVTTSVAAGGFTMERSFDEAGNVLTSKTSGHTLSAAASYDSRGLLIESKHPDAPQSKIAYTYDALGNMTRYTDEQGKATSFDTDALGRIVKSNYPDGTCEQTVYEDGSGFVSAHRDRAGQWLVYRYRGYTLDTVMLGPIGAAEQCTAAALTTAPDANQQLFVYTYDLANRLRSVASAGSAVEYDEYDLAGRPHVTRSIRYRAASGLTTKDVLDVHTQRHVWSVFGERERFRMPIPGLTVPSTASSSAWRSWIEEKHDPAGNIASQKAILSETNPAVGPFITQSAARGMGRLASRDRTLSGSNSLQALYGYAETGQQGITAPAPYSGLLGRTEFHIGDDTIAGSVITRDAAQRIQSIAPAATNTRLSSFSYDDRDRLTESVLGGMLTGGDQPTVTDTNDKADFRTKRSVMRLTSNERTKLGAAIARAIELPSFLATPNDAHQITTLDFDGQLPPDVQFAFAGGRRAGDGKWNATYDALGRLIQLTRQEPAAGAPNRYEYDYNPQNRLVGRRVCLNSDANPCQFDTEMRDGLPPHATFVWDPISDRLLAIFEADKSSGNSPGEYDGLLRQYIHGDQGYDDPVEVLVATSSGAAPKRYLPLLDEAGTGNVTAVLGDDGTLIERVLYGDSYGASPRYLQGPAVEKIAHTVTKNAAGEITEVRFSATLSEPVVASTIASGVRLRSVKADGSLALLSTVVASIDDSSPQTIRWTLNAADWNALTTADGATAIEVAVTNTLRAKGWGATAVMQPPAWLKTLTGIRSTATEPVIAAESIATIAASNDEQTIFALRDLYTIASEQSKTGLLMAFKALPFVDPATGYAYARNRWYDASIGSFLTPDPEGYGDSANLYTFAAGDPLNYGDPTGNEAALGLGGTIAATRRNGSIRRISPEEIAADPAGARNFLMTESNLYWRDAYALVERAGHGEKLSSNPLLHAAVTGGAKAQGVYPLMAATAGAGIGGGVGAVAATELGLGFFGATMLPGFTGGLGSQAGTDIQAGHFSGVRRYAVSGSVGAVGSLVIGGVFAGGQRLFGFGTPDVFPSIMPESGWFPPASSRVMSAADLHTLPAPKGDRVILSPYSFRQGKINIYDLVEQQAASLGGRTLAELPYGIKNMIPEINNADEIIFYTSPGLVERGGLTMEEMIYIQSNPALRAKTIFVYGGYNDIPGVQWPRAVKPVN